MGQHERGHMNHAMPLLRKELEPILAFHVPIIDVLVVQCTLDKIWRENRFKLAAHLSTKLMLII